MFQFYFNVYLRFVCGKYFGTRKALRMYEAKNTERSSTLAKTLVLYVY